MWPVWAPHELQACKNIWKQNMKKNETQIGQTYEGFHITIYTDRRQSAIHTSYKSCLQPVNQWRQPNSWQPAVCVKALVLSYASLNRVTGVRQVNRVYVKWALVWSYCNTISHIDTNSLYIFCKNSVIKQIPTNFLSRFREQFSLTFRIFGVNCIGLYIWIRSKFAVGT